VGHLLVLAILIDLLVGTWAAIVTWQRYQRHGVSQLRHLFHYVVSFNVMVFGYLVAQYAFTNLIGENPMAFPRHVLVMSVGVYLIEVALSWTALRLGWDLRHREFPTNLRRGFVALATIFGLSYVVGITLLVQSGGLRWLVRTHMALGLAMTAVLVTVFIGLATCRSRQLSEDQRRSVRLLGWGLLGGHLAFAGSVALPPAAHLFSMAAAMLWLNCVPLLWLLIGFGLYHRASESEAGVAAVARLAQEHGITQREREVMELIVQGKSNKEIEERLFISFSTVKNHAYSLYRKLGVKSRAQLIHLVMVSASRSAEVAGPEGGPARDGTHGPDWLRFTRR
jgi:DNA-binding CsgD family transcriptional regulator